MKPFWRFVLIIFLILVPVTFACVFFYIGYFVINAGESGPGKILTTVNAQTRDNTNQITSQFVLNIPKIALTQKIEPNIDPWDQAVYGPILERNLAHGKYTLLPNQLESQQKGITYIFGHRVGTGGFLERLDELDSGDSIYINFNGTQYTFQVLKKFVVPASQTDIYTASSPTPLLRIQTCENGEVDRLIVDAILVR